MEERRVDIPFVDLRAQARELHDELAAVFESVTSRAAYTMGPELTEFEEAFAAFCDVESCIGVSSGTDAVKLALLGACVGPGDEVIVPVNTFIATAEAVSHIGAVPVFVDVDEETALMDPEALADVCAEREGMLSAVIPVHLYGQPCDMDAIEEIAREHGLAVVEDACQAHGALYRGVSWAGSGSGVSGGADGRACGSMGITAAFSFYPGKNLGALGDGGAVTTNDAAVADRLRLLRNHGQEDKYTHGVIGYCDRLHNLQAALLNVKLPHLHAWNEQRRAAARVYDEGCGAIGGVSPIALRDDGEAVYHLYVVRLPDADEPNAARADLRDRLAAAGVESGIHYPVPLHLQPAYGHLGYSRGQFPVAEGLAERIVSLPLFPGITREQQDHVLGVLAEAVER